MKVSKKTSKTFIGFLVASFFIWVLITFSKEYVTIVTYPVNYIHIPQNKLLQETPIKEIDIAIKASGFKILRTRITNSKVNLEILNLKRKQGSYFYFLPKDQTVKIQKQLFSGVKIQEILQDTVFLNLGFLASKKVALKPNISIDYHIGYGLLNELEIEPDSIVISGPKAHIEKIEYLNLSTLKLNDVKSNFTKQVAIEPSKKNNLKYSLSEAVISGKVEKFTEGSLKIPFSTKNLPENVNLTTLSENVEITFVVALPYFSKVSVASFTVECDYAVSNKNNLSYLIPKVISKPDFIKSYKIVPTKIDFLIQK